MDGGACRLQSMGSLRVGHDWATSLSLFIFMHWRRKWQPTPVFLHGESQGQGAWWAAVYGVAQSRTPLKGLSSSGKIFFKWEKHVCWTEVRRDLGANPLHSHHMTVWPHERLFFLLGPELLHLKQTGLVLSNWVGSLDLCGSKMLSPELPGF